MSERVQQHRFSVAVSRLTDPTEAAEALVQHVSRDLRGSPVDLAFVFLSPHHAVHAEAVTKMVREQLAPTLLLGCTGEGIIGGTEEIESAPALTLWAAHLPGVRLAPLRLSDSPVDLEASLSEAPDSHRLGDDPPAFLLLADPFSAPMNDVLSWLGDRFPGATAVGGLAGGGHEPGQNRLVLNGEVFDHGLVGVGLSGPVWIRTIISQGCRPIGDRYVVTKAEHNVIHELGGKPALEQLQRVFESLSVEEQQHANRALHLGIVIDEHRNRFERGDFLVRNLIGADKSSGSVAVGEIVQEGQTVQFHVRDAESASEDLGLLVASDRQRHPQPALGGLLFSCCARGRALFGQPHHDIGVIRREAGSIPIGGFFAQGEIGPVGGSNFLHGYTASLALFCSPTP